MTGSPSLMAELEGAMASRSDQGRNDTLRKVTDLFVGNAPSYNREQVALFDTVIGRLAENTDVPARVELSERLATLDNAPASVVQKLAADDTIDVAGPILTRSNLLDGAQLAALAATKGGGHLVGRAGRRQLGQQVTDALLKRGDSQAARTVATNMSARVSENGYETLAGIAAGDPSFAECVVQRPDIPHRHFKTLVMLAPEAVQRRLASTNPRLAERIRQAIAEASQETAQAAQRDYTAAKEAVSALAKSGALGDQEIHDLAKAGQFEEAVVALAILTRMPIEAASRLMSSEPTDTVLIAAKAADLTWPTAKHLVLLRTAGRASPQDLEDAKTSFLRLKPETAKQGLQFYKARARQG